MVYTSFGYSGFNSAADYMHAFPEYVYTKYVHGTDTAYLIDDPQDEFPYTRYNIVLGGGAMFGWDSKEECLEELSGDGFVETDDVVTYAN